GGPGPGRRRRAARASGRGAAAPAPGRRRPARLRLSAGPGRAGLRRRRASATMHGLFRANPPMSRMSFELLATDGAARRGRLAFPRGTVETPAFMPVGTYGTVKGMLPRPGLEVIEAHGGLHGFARWDGPILTDSGGFQVFSLAHRRRITEAGVTFAAPTDGSKVFLGPEESMHIQKVLGSDIVMIFDECPPVQVGGKPVDRRVVERSMELSLRWAERSKRAHAGSDAALFGIVQGGVHHDLRTRSAEGLKAIGF